MENRLTQKVKEVVVRGLEKTALERETYESRSEWYQLDSSKVFDVVAELARYVKFAPREAKRKNPDYLLPSVTLIGKGRNLSISVEKVHEGVLESVNLVELSLGENDGLEMRIDNHSSLTINPEYLYTIVERYGLTQEGETQ